MARQMKLRICLILFMLTVVSVVLGIGSSDKAYAIACCEDCDPNYAECYSACCRAYCCCNPAPDCGSTCFAACDNQYSYCWGHCVYCNS